MQSLIHLQYSQNPSLYFDCMGLFNKLCQKRENHYIYPINTSLNEKDRRI
jgi:hypothetical protein